ncbi:hypothetical protein ACERIT_05645 [Halopenitus sp. H-Gu1]|uniref:hypothetical protein n=1 Tax=Halopenitus sp. H-Gu1 TaxID=3242697 RepID=UPI00359E1C1F
MMSELTRRKLLASTGAIGTVGLAGCLGGRDGEVPPPEVTDDRIEEWELVDESSGTIFEREVGPVTVTALEHTLAYEHRGVAAAVAETFDSDGSPVVLFATRVDLRPGLDRLPFGIGRDRVMSQVETAADKAFRRQLASAGLEDIRRTNEGTLEIDTGHEATVYTYRASFSTASTVEIAPGVTEEVTGTVEMEGRVAVWHDGRDVLLAGGTYPIERLTTAIDEGLPEGGPDAEELVDSEALSADPTTYEEDVEALIVSVE